MPRQTSLRTELLVGSSRVESRLEALETFYRSCGEPDPIAAPGFYLSRQAAAQRLPVVAAVGPGQPSAVGLFSAVRRWGVPTGLLRSGNSAGDGAVIAPGDRLQALSATVAATFRLPWVHTVAASLRVDSQPELLQPVLTQALARDLTRYDVRHSFSQVGTDLSLQGGFEGFLSRLRPRSRRNYRYFRRRAEAEMGLSFVPQLTQEDAVEAVTRLHAVGLHPLPRARSLLTERTIRDTPGSFAMGLKTPDSQWLSYLSGWRRMNVTYVELQLNDHRHPALSLSTVMRTCLIEHEAAHGADRIVFVGGSTEALGRYCEPSLSLNLLVMRRGLRGWLARGMARAVSPNGQTTTMLRDTAAPDGPAPAAAGSPGDAPPG